MGLFDKKYCDICGNKIGLLGNRKLDDGNLCKDCASKLSPWFSDRRHSTVENIRTQLEYREANKEAVSSFHTTRTLGRVTKVLLDEDNRKFMVAKTSRLSEENPDVMNFSDVTGCDIDVQESKSEIKKKLPDGKEESYTPPKYSYSYNLYFIIQVNNPYFDEIRFQLNDSSITMETQMTPHPTTDVNYREAKSTGEEIKKALMQIREDARSSAAPKMAVTCPCCGATTIPTANGCCEYCGSSLNG